MKKIIALLLVITTTVAVSIGATLAYLTDRDSEANVFTVGDVSIDLNEDFNQGSTLIPGVDIKKEPTITNTGKNAAYVWAEIAVPAALDNEDASKNVIHFNMSKESIAEGLWNWTPAGEYLVKTVEIEGVLYNVYTVLYDTALQPGETTVEPVIYKVYMDDHVDIDPDGNWHHVLGGEVTDIDWSSEDGNPVIYVSAYAIQTEGFDTVEEAYAAYQTQWGGNGAEYSEVPCLVYNVEEMREAMKIPGVKMILGDDIYIPTHSSGYALYAKYDCEIDLNGHDIIADYPGEEFWGVIYALNGAKVDIVGEGNINVKGGVGYWVRGTGANGDTEINIYGGNWIAESTDFSSDSYCEGMQANKEAHINIYGGFFEWHDDFVKYTANESNEGVVTIYGGTFVNFDPRVSHDSDGSYVAEGYTVVLETQANGDVWYTVVPA